jgi:hypothetical protein
MATHVNPLAGKPASISSLINVAKLVTAYYECEPDPSFRGPPQLQQILKEAQASVDAVIAPH